MRDRSYLCAGLFSLGLHGVFATFLIPPLPKISSSETAPINVVWVKTSSLQKKNEVSLKKRPLHLEKAAFTPPVQDTFKEMNALQNNGPQRTSPKVVLIAKSTSSRKAYHPLPSYPWICRKRHQEGVVTVTLKTDIQGHVIKASLHKSSGHSKLDDVVLEACKAWIFTESNHQKTLSIAFRLKG